MTYQNPTRAAFDAVAKEKPAKVERKNHRGQVTSFHYTYKGMTIEPRFKTNRYGDSSLSVLSYFINGTGDIRFNTFYKLSEVVAFIDDLLAKKSTEFDAVKNPHHLDEPIAEYLKQVEAEKEPGGAVLYRGKQAARLVGKVVYFFDKDVFDEKHEFKTAKEAKCYALEWAATGKV